MLTDMNTNVVSVTFYLRRQTNQATLRLPAAIYLTAIGLGPKARFIAEFSRLNSTLLHQLQSTYELPYSLLLSSNLPRDLFHLVQITEFLQVSLYGVLI